MHFPPGFFRIFLSTVDKMIGTKYISTKYVDRNYNIHLQNTTTLLPIIQELFFHVIIFFVLLKLKTYIVFLRRKYQLKNVFKNKQLVFSIKKKNQTRNIASKIVYMIFQMQQQPFP